MEDMPDIALDALPIAFGNFRRGYLVVDRIGMTMVRDNVTQPGWTKFYFAKRVGGAVIDSNAIKFLKMAAA
jgi:HK97 family phage major capsid protein